MIPLLRIDEEFEEGNILSRPNRFTLIVDVNGIKERAYLANPGRLSTLIEEGREILLLRREDENRKTSYDAFAIRLGSFHVTLRSAFANELFKAIVEKEAIENFKGYDIVEREKLIEGYGRVDFILANEAGKKVFVEVKSCTHVENGVAKFPDAPTERGRRHVRALIELARRGNTCYLFFIIQRPDAKIFTPFREVDPEFASLVEKASHVGVRIRAVVTEFDRLYNIVYLKDLCPITF